jgi:hypothetical protein
VTSPNSNVERRVLAYLKSDTKSSELLLKIL